VAQSDGGFAIARFNLSTGTLHSAEGSGGPTGVGGSITLAANGFYKCTLTATMTITTTLILFGIQAPSNITNNNYIGDGTSGLYIWGAQLEAAPFASPYIKTEATTVTRAATNLSLSATNIIAANDFGQLLEWIPGATGQTGVLWSTRVDASNYTQISCTPTQILYTKVISGVATTVTVTYTHTVNVPVRIQAHQDSVLGMSLRVRQQGAAWSAYVTDPSVSAQPVGATYQEGAINNTTHAAGYYPGNFFVTGNLAKLESEVAKVS
jgi:hypothetical protein